MSETSRPDAPDVADVLVPVAVDHPYSYRIPTEMTLAEGDFVAVSLGSREAFGVVWSLRGGAWRQSQACGLPARPAAFVAKIAGLHRLGRRLDAGAARHGVAHGDTGGA